MTKYDQAVETEKRNAKLIIDLNNQFDIKERRDKTGLGWNFDSMDNERQYNALKFSTGCHHGSYGSSSQTDDNSVEIGKEIAKTLNQLKPEILNITINRLEEKTRAARRAAKEEAENILQELEADDG